MGNFIREDYPVRTLISGDSLYLSVFRFQGAGSGPSTYIQANVHGNEMQGNAVIYHLLKYLEKNPPLGEIVLVPFANPFGVNQKMGEYGLGRFDPTTGLNWNRTYWRATASYGGEEQDQQRKDPDQINLEEFCRERKDRPWSEIKNDFKAALNAAVRSRLLKSAQGLIEAPYKLGLLLQSLSTSADFVLDLHTGPASARYVYAPEYALASSIHFNVPHIILIPRYFDGAMDEASFCPWWDLHEMFQKLGRATPLDFEAYTLEVGSQEWTDFEAAKTDAQNIIRYLKAKGVLATTSPDLMEWQKQTLYACSLANYKGVFAPEGGLMEYLVRPGEKVKRGEKLGQILNFRKLTSSSCPVETALTPILCSEDALIINHFPSPGVHEGMELYRFFTHYWEVGGST